MFDEAFEVQEFEPGVPFSAAGFEIKACRLPHYELIAHGFRVTQNGTTLAYSGDSAPTEELAALARGADLFLCEATLAEGTPTTGCPAAISPRRRRSRRPTAGSC